LFLLVSNLTFSQNVPQFKLNDIPFGKTENEVLSMLTGANVKYENEGINVGDFCGNRTIRNYFVGGIYSIMGHGAFFNNDITKKVIVTYDGWENIESIDLYFTKTFNKNDYTLFLVEKMMKSQKGNHATIMKSLVNSVSKIMGKPALIETSKYIDTDEYSTDSKLAAWDLGTKKVFLLTVNYIFSIEPMYVYVSKSGLSKYKRSCVLYKNAIKREQEKKSEKSIDDF